MTERDRVNHLQVEKVDFDPFAGGDLDRIVPMTGPQQEIWTSVQLGADGNCAFNESVAVTLRGMLDQDALALAFNDVVARHEALRATCTTDGKSLCIVRSLDVTLPLLDLSADGREAAAHRYADILEGASTTPFDLEHGPLIRAALVRLAADHHVLVMTSHHIVCDGWSTGVILEDMGKCYTARKRNIAAGLRPADAFSDYALAMAERSRDGQEAKDAAYWLGVFGAPPEPLELPADRQRPALRTFAADRYDYALDAPLVASLKKLAGKSGVTFLSVMVTGLGSFLCRISGQRDLVIGVPAAGQFSSGKHGLVGHCVSLMPIRLRIDPELDVTGTIKAQRPVLLDAFEHQVFTYGSLLQQLPLARDPSRPPLVAVVFNIDTGIGALGFDGLEVSVTTPPRRFENFELFINATDNGGRLELECTYNTDLFSREWIERQLAAFTVMLEDMCRQPEAKLASLSVLPQDQVAALAAINDTARACAPARGVAGLFEDQARLSPGVVAVQYGADSLTYGELNRRANRLARRLAEAGVGPDSLVGIHLARGLDLPTGLLAVMKTGAAYVPLDPEYPAARLEYMVADARLALVLTTTELAGSLPGQAAQILVDAPAADDGTDVADPTAPIDPDAVVYIIYTSGSTGQPKGVQVTHQGLANFLLSMREQPGLTAGDTLLAVTTLSFDIATLELYLPLITGAKVVIADRETAADGQQLMSLLDSCGATVMQATPATWHMLVAAGWNGNGRLKVLCGGEALPRSLADDLLARSGELWNMYGPTETTVWSTCARITGGRGEITIGAPIANTTVHVLDENRQPVPLGVPGELYIGGMGLARGYLNRPDLTERQFVLVPDAAGGTRRLYRTGDRVRIGVDRRLTYLNRLDNQVKVRGFRIELGEIETALASHPDVGNCVVIARAGDGGDTRLIAYLVPQAAGTFDVKALRAHLRGTLPEYMVPQHFVKMTGLPLTPAGKVDRRALPDPDGGDADAGAGEYIAPATETEIAIAAIWAKALGRERIGTSDNFFDLGGHSLLATQILAQVKKKLGLVVSLRQFFEHPTVAGLAGLATPRAERAPEGIAIPRRRDQAAARLSLQQQRLWYIEELEPGSTVYNLPAAFRLHGALDRARFQASLDTIFARHEALRTAIVNADQGARQWLTPDLRFTLPVVDLSGLGKDEREEQLARSIAAETGTCQKLSSPTLFRATLFILGPDEHVFFFMPHHAVWDGWSFDIFLRDLRETYEALATGAPPNLPELPVQYADYAEWQRDWAQSGALAAQIDYWKDKLKGTLPVLHLPADRPRPPVMVYNHAGNEEIFLPRELVDKLTEVARRQDATLFMILLAAYNVLLHKYAGDQRDILVGIPISGRNHAETADLIGFFVNTLVIRTNVEPDLPFGELLRQTRENCLEAYNHQDAPFERLIEVLNPVRDRSRSPVFQVMFAYQDVRNRIPRMADLRLEQINVARAGVQTDIDFWVRLSDAGLAGGFEYNADLFTPLTIRRMLGHYLQILAGIVADVASPVRDVSVLTADDRALLSGTWSASRVTVGTAPSLHAMVERQVAASPSAIALRCGGQVFTYRELDRRANILANHFRQHGAGPGTLVGIHLERTGDMFAAVLAVLKTGAAYVPMDPEYPAERLAMMAQDAAPCLVVTERALAAVFPAAGAPLLCLDDLARERDDASPPGVATSPEDPAYVIFTSGSTGRPKGVQVPHRAVTNFLLSMQQEPGLVAGDVLLAVTTLSFDISVLEIFLPLVTGATIVAADRETIADAGRLAALIRNCGATVMQATPVTWRMLLAAGWSGSPTLKILCGGEAFPRDLAANLVDKCASLWNMYGPTETTVWSTCAQVTDTSRAPLIGRPIAGTTVHVVDENLELVPPGVAGELLIGGTGVTLGYLGQPELTRERFLPDRFAARSGESEPGLLYRTGDLVRFQADGSLEYLSRTDDQVKVRGFRIELGEIEATLSQHPHVGRAVVTCYEARPGDTRLVAYVLPKGRPGPAAAELREHLRATLPEYMVPQHFVEIGEIPLTPAGKIDRRRLPPPELNASRIQGQYKTPGTETERLLHGIWSRILQSDAIDINDSFFDIGGHSLLAVEAFSGIRAAFGIELPLAALFDAPTIHTLGRRIDAAVYAAGSPGSVRQGDDDREEVIF